MQTHKLSSHSSMFVLSLIIAFAMVLFGRLPEAHAQGGARPIQVPAIVGGAALNLPSGSILINKPAYSWNEVVDATWYYLWVSKVNDNNSQTTIYKQWYTSAVCSAGTCSVTPDATLSAGNYKWWIQTYNDAGYGPWSPAMDFTVSVPGAAALTSPSGDIGTNYNPAYTWNTVTGATWYYLWVDGPSGNVIKQWYEASLICNASTCSATPAKTLAGGAHKAWIQTWSPVGYGAWSSVMDFNTAIPPLPGGATLVSPSGSITDTTPDYTWNKVNGATWYYLWANGPSGTVLQKWYEATSVCSGSICSVTPAEILGPGAHSFYVQTWNSTGYGPWSAAMNFSMPIPWPLQPTVISPISWTNDLTPPYSWNTVSSETGVPATWYNLIVNGPGGPLVDKWYETSAICSGGTCSITPATILIPGSTYTWQVRGYNSAGNGQWSDLRSFTHSSIGGFNSSFNGLSSGWTTYSGLWSITNNAWYGAYGTGSYYATSGYIAATYSNFDVQTRVYTDTPHEAYVIVRGNPSPFDGYADWNSGYYFGFDGYGYYTVGKMLNGTWTTFQPWTYTPNLNIGNWNTLRVVAAGSNLYYYINGILIWSGVDYSLTSGIVGFELGTDTSHSLWIDSVTLNSYYARSVDTSIVRDRVSPEQQALNDAALNGVSDKAPGRYLKSDSHH